MGLCINFLQFYYVNTATEVLFDFWVMLLPVGVIGELTLPRKTKVGLGGALWVRTPVGSCEREILSVAYFDLPDLGGFFLQN